MKKKTDSPLARRVGVYENLQLVEILTLKEVLQYPDHLDAIQHKGLRRKFEQIPENIQAYRDSKEVKDNGEIERLTVFKKKIPAFTPAGLYGHNRRGEPKERSFQVQLDFDGFTMPLEDLKKKVKELFNKFEWITFAGISASGEGFYILANTASEDYEGHYYSLWSLFQKEGFEMDLAVSSVNEIRYISMPSEGFIREFPSLYKEVKKRPVTPYDDIKPTGDGKIVPLDKSQKGKLRYSDLPAWVGKNILNGVTLSVLLSNIGEEDFDPKSKTRRQKSWVRELTRMYESFSRNSPAGYLAPAIKGKSLLPYEYPELQRKFLIVKGKKEEGGDTIETAARKVVAYCIENPSIKLTVDATTGTIYRRSEDYLQEIPEPMAIQAITDIATELQLPEDWRGGRFYRAVREEMHVSAARPIVRNRNALNLDNVVLEFLGGGQWTMRDHDPNDTFTYKLPYNYQAKATCPRVDKFLDRVMKPEDQNMFWEYIASTFLVGRMKIHKMLFLVGASQTGKSTLAELVLDLFGNGAATTSVAQLTNGAPLQSEVAIHNLVGKVIAIDTDCERIVDRELFKKIAAQEPVKAKKYHVQPYETDQYPLIVACANHVPNIETGRQGQRRFLPIQMDIVIGSEEQDRELRAKLAAERAGVLLKVLAAYERVGKRGFIEESNTALAYRSELMYENDLFAQWMDHHGIEQYTGKGKEEYKVQRGVILNEFNGWSKEFAALDRRFSARVVGRMLTDKGFKESLSVGVRYFSFQIRDIQDGGKTIPGEPPAFMKAANEQTKNMIKNRRKTK